VFLVGFARFPVVAALTLAILALASSHARGNGATYGGSGADVYPIENHQVSMRKEFIVLTVQGDDTSWRSSEVSFDCTFWFVNHGDRTTVPMGFPLAADSSGWEVPPDSSALGFRVAVDGTPAGFRRASDGRVLLWPVAFAAGQERVVHVEYFLPWSSSDLSLYRQSITYVLRTGALWRDPIAESVLEVRSGVHMPLVAMSFDPPPDRYQAGTARWIFHDVRPTRDLRVSFNPELADKFSGRFEGPVDFKRVGPGRAARELLELIDLEWEESLLAYQPSVGDPPDLEAEHRRAETADSARAARIELEARVHLSPIERMNLGYARAVERACRNPAPASGLTAKLAEIHRRFW
jgi:hypothetical protein